MPHVPSAELDLGGGQTIHIAQSLKAWACSASASCAARTAERRIIWRSRMPTTVIVVGVPAMSPDNRNEAIRFTKLIDALYENGVKLFVTAAAEPEDLYTAGDGAFEFERTVSGSRK